MIISDRPELRPMTLEEYKEMKIEMLGDFCIYLTDDEKNHLNKLKTEIQVDQFYISKIMNY